MDRDSRKNIIKRFFEIDDDTPVFDNVEKVSPVVKKRESDKPVSVDEPAISRNPERKRSSLEITIDGQRMSLDDLFLTSKADSYEEKEVTIMPVTDRKEIAEPSPKRPPLEEVIAEKPLEEALESVVEEFIPVEESKAPEHAEIFTGADAFISKEITLPFDDLTDGSFEVDTYSEAESDMEEIELTEISEVEEPVFEEIQEEEPVIEEEPEVEEEPAIEEEPKIEEEPVIEEEPEVEEEPVIEEEPEVEEEPVIEEEPEVEEEPVIEEEPEVEVEPVTEEEPEIEEEPVIEEEPAVTEAHVITEEIEDDEPVFEDDEYDVPVFVSREAATITLDFDETSMTDEASKEIPEATEYSDDKFVINTLFFDPDEEEAEEEDIEEEYVPEIVDEPITTNFEVELIEVEDEPEENISFDNEEDDTMIMPEIQEEPEIEEKVIEEEVIEEEVIEEEPEVIEEIVEEEPEEEPEIFEEEIEEDEPVFEDDDDEYAEYEDDDDDVEFVSAGREQRIFTPLAPTDIEVTERMGEKVEVFAENDDIVSVNSKNKPSYFHDYTLDEEEHEEYYVPRKPFGRRVLGWLATIAIAVCLAIVINVYLVRPSRVSGESMLPTLQNNEIVFLSRVPYLLSDVKEGDVVVIDSRVDESRNELTLFREVIKYNVITHLFGVPEPEYFYVKRVIATEGQTLEFKDGKIYRDGGLLYENYINEQEVTTYPEGVTITVEPGHVFVMGDNRNHSTDSRKIGQIPLSHIIGKQI